MSQTTAYRITLPGDLIGAIPTLTVAGEADADVAEAIHRHITAAGWTGIAVEADLTAGVAAIDWDGARLGVAVVERAADVERRELLRAARRLSALERRVDGEDR